MGWRAYDPQADLLSGWTTRFGAANSIPVASYDYTFDKAWRRNSARLGDTAFERTRLRKSTSETPVC